MTSNKCINMKISNQFEINVFQNFLVAANEDKCMNEM